jgi:hypothetical protein
MVRQALLGVLLASLGACQPHDAAGPAARGPLRNAPPLIELDAPAEYVGHGQAVRIGARISDPEGRPVTARWLQISGPPADFEVDGAATLSFRTLDLDELSPPRDGPISVLALPPSKAGHYRFSLTASDGEAEASAEIDVRAGAANPGWPRAALKTATFLDAGIAQDSYEWVVSFGPPKANPFLADAGTRRPALVLSRPGRYTVRESVSGRELSIHSGPWMGTEQCGRLECHPRETLGWSSTKMATVLARGLDGKLRSDYGPECLRCHTVGYDLAAENDGFDDVATKVGWVFPRRLQPGNYASLPKTLSDRGNVGCEACHGPGRFYTSYSTEVCAGCHESPPDYVNPVEWRLAPMSKIRDGVLDRAECRRCHTAQGFVDEFFGHRPVQETAREEDAEYTPEPITCGACHDTHNGERERLVRYGGPLFGQEPDVDWGTGMVCLACHHGGQQWFSIAGGVMRPFVPRSKTPPATFTPTLWDRRLAPHAPQAEMVRGRGGFALPGPGPLEASPPHLTVPGGCVGCHVRTRPALGDARRGLVGGHTFAMFSGEGAARVENTAPCATCHGELDSLSREVRFDYDGNGAREGIYEEVTGLLDRTKAALDHAITTAALTDGRRQAASFGELDGHIVLVDAEGAVLGEPDQPMTIPVDQDRLYRCVFNYLFVKKDRSMGVHNPVWTVRLLQRTILRAAPREVPRWYWR